MPTFTETAEVSITIVIYGKRCSELCDGLQFVEKCVALALVTCTSVFDGFSEGEDDRFSN